MQVVKDIRALFPAIEREAPPGVQINVVNDRSEFIQASIHEVEFHLILSVVLVVMVILVFLRNARSTLITALILPTSVIGTFAAMYMLGFSMNNLSLMAIILSVGFRRRRRDRGAGEHHAPHGDGQGPHAGGARRLEGDRLHRDLDDAVAVGCVHPDPVHAGHAGRLFREFAVTVGCAVLISGVVALSMTPMLCSLLLQAYAPARPRLHGPGEGVRRCSRLLSRRP